MSAGTDWRERRDAESLRAWFEYQADRARRTREFRVIELDRVRRREPG